MYNANMAGMWGIPPAKTPPKEAEEPNNCSFCACRIEEGDYYWIGYDEHKIYGECCDSHFCKQWLENKARLKKGYPIR